MRGLAAGVLDRHLSPGLEGDRVVQDLFHLVESELVHVPHLVGIHEAGIAHHVTSVGEVDGEHRAAAVANGGGAVPVDQLVALGGEVPPVVTPLDDPVHLGVDGERVFEGPVLRAGLPHQDPAVLLQDRGLDLAEVAVDQLGQVALAPDDRVAGFHHAPGAERVGLPRPSQRRLRPLPGLEQGSRSPFRLDRRMLGNTGVDRLEHLPSRVREFLDRGSQQVVHTPPPPS